MNEAYIDLKRRDGLLEIIDFAIRDGFDEVDFINKLMNSHIGLDYFMLYDLHYFNPFSVYKDVLSEYAINKSIKPPLPKVVLAYIAFIYTKFYLRTKETPDKIIKYLPVIYIVDKYHSLHIQNEEKVIFDSKLRFNIQNNPIRGERSKNNVSFNKYQTKRLLFTGKKIYTKLFYYPELMNLTFNFDTYPFFRNETTFIVASKISSKEDITNAFMLDGSENHRSERVNNILMLFIDDKYSNDEMESLLDFVALNNITLANPYDKVLCFRKNYLIYLNNTTRFKLNFIYSYLDDKLSEKECENI